MIRIGIVGSKGICGEANYFAFKKLGHEVLEHDIKLNTKLDDLIKTKVIFICVPTPSNEDGSCNTTIVENIVHELVKIHDYQGIIAIRSTITPGTTLNLINTYNNYKICHVPEFLRERHNLSDLIENQKLLVIGGDFECFTTVKECFGHYPHQSMQVTPTEAELIKYWHNTFNALRITFANEFYEIAKKCGVNYTTIKNVCIKIGNLPDQYLDANENFCRGYSSICFNKDIPAIINFAETIGLNLGLIPIIPLVNNKFKKTPFANTRE